MYTLLAACTSFRACTDTLRLEGLKYSTAAGAGVLGKLIGDILPLVLTIGGFIAVVVIVISGIQFVLSGGNPEGAAAARNRLIYAIVGFIIIILAFAVMQIVNRLFLGNTGIV